MKLFSFDLCRVYSLFILFAGLCFSGCSKKEALFDPATRLHTLRYTLHKLQDKQEDYLEVFANGGRIDTLGHGTMAFDRNVYYVSFDADSVVFSVRKRGNTTDLIRLFIPGNGTRYSPASAIPYTLYYDGQTVSKAFVLTRPEAGKAGYRFRNQLTGYLDIPLDMKIFKVSGGTYEEILKVQNIRTDEYGSFTELNALPAGSTYMTRFYRAGTSELIAASTGYANFLPFTANESSLVDIRVTNNAISFYQYKKQ